MLVVSEPESELSGYKPVVAVSRIEFSSSADHHNGAPQIFSSPGHWSGGGAWRGVSAM